MKVIYPVLFYEEKEGGYSVFVPDLQKALNTSASTCGSTLEEAMSMAEDFINMYAEKWGKELVKKTVNIPKWVNAKAESLKINFSKTLEEALLQKIYKE